MKVKLEMAEEAAEAKRQNLNMSVEEWKNKYLFPFGDIAPMPDNNKIHNYSTDGNAGGSTLGDQNLDSAAF